MTRLFFRTTWLIVFALFSPACFSASILVIYPDVKPAYKQLFYQIIEGIEAEAPPDVTSVDRLELGEKADRHQVAKQIFENPPDMVITLGRRAYGVAQILEGRIPVVTGAVPIGKNSVSGVSLVVDPDVMFGYLSQLAPNVKNIFVVYSAQNEWLIKLARERAKQKGYELNAFPASNVKAAVKLYQRLIKQVDYEKDAFWLPLDRVTSNDKVVLPMMLEAAWNKRFVLFSSKPFHAKRGVLFSPVPDQRLMGRRLRDMVYSMFSASTVHAVEPLRQVLLAVNLRTASHLDIEYSPKQRTMFDFIFPSERKGR